MKNIKTDSRLTSLDGIERIRGYYLSPVSIPKISLVYNSFNFNTPCVRMFPETEYVEILVNQQEKQLIVFPCNQTNQDSVKWSKIKANEIQPRKIQAKHFCENIFEVMGWNEKYRYKVLADLQEHNGQKHIVFNLASFEMSGLIPEHNHEDREWGKVIPSSSFNTNILHDRRKSKNMTQKDVSDKPNINMRH